MAFWGVRGWVYFPQTPQICEIGSRICEKNPPICQVFSPICGIFSQICEFCDTFSVRTGTQICNPKSRFCEVRRRRVRNSTRRRDRRKSIRKFPFASISHSSFTYNAFATLGAQGATFRSGPCDPVTETPQTLAAPDPVAACDFRCLCKAAGTRASRPGWKGPRAGSTATRVRRKCDLMFRAGNASVITTRHPCLHNRGRFQIANLHFEFLFWQTFGTHRKAEVRIAGPRRKAPGNVCGGARKYARREPQRNRTVRLGELPQRH